MVKALLALMKIITRPSRYVPSLRLLGKTGVEMEALTAVQVGLLTVYDMCKAIDKRMHMEEIHLVEKQGGKSGAFYYEEEKE